MSTEGPRQFREREARELLRGVDEQLLRYGPRRALQRLEEIWLQIPYGMGRRFQEYQKVVAGILERTKTQEEDAERIWQQRRSSDAIPDHNR